MAPDGRRHRCGAGRTVTSYLTNANHGTAAKSTIALKAGAFTATVPARSLVTFRVTAGSARG